MSSPGFWWRLRSDRLRATSPADHADAFIEEQLNQTLHVATYESAIEIVGGVGALTNATIIMGLPFSFVMFLVMLGLYKALRVERFREDAARTSLSSSLSERTTIEARGVTRTWRQRLARAMHYPDEQTTTRFMTDVCRPAFTEVAAELREQGADAQVREGVVTELGIPYHELTVAMGTEEEFTYRAWPCRSRTPSFAPRRGAGAETYYRVEVYLTEGSQGYDVLGYSTEQLISNLPDGIGSWRYVRCQEFVHLTKR